MPNQRGQTRAIKQQTLVQDHAEGGARCLDIEFFVRAVYARWVRRLLRPTPMPWKNIAYQCINNEYGHLGQGSRLLLSNCDFLRLRGRAPACCTHRQLLRQARETRPGACDSLKKKKNRLI